MLAFTRDLPTCSALCIVRRVCFRETVHSGTAWPVMDVSGLATGGGTGLARKSGWMWVSAGRQGRGLVDESGSGAWVTDEKDWTEGC